MKMKGFVYILRGKTLPGYTEQIPDKPTRVGDELLCGDPNKEITKAASTIIVTVEVIRQAMA